MWWTYYRLLDGAEVIVLEGFSPFPISVVSDVLGKKPGAV